MKIKYRVNGQEVSRQKFLSKRSKGVPLVNRAWSKPITPEAAGVHPSQVAAAMEHDRRMGVPTDYTSDGKPIIKSAEHYRKYLRANGLFDRAGRYGSPRNL
jgi:hypothetical protein